MEIIQEKSTGKTYGEKSTGKKSTGEKWRDWIHSF
jgi:hypothetical protein